VGEVGGGQGGSTALELAAARGHVAVVHLLLAAERRRVRAAERVVHGAAIHAACARRRLKVLSVQAMLRVVRQLDAGRAGSPQLYPSALAWCRLEVDAQQQQRRRRRQGPAGVHPATEVGSEGRGTAAALVPFRGFVASVVEASLDTTLGHTARRSAEPAPSPQPASPPTSKSQPEPELEAEAEAKPDSQPEAEMESELEPKSEPEPELPSTSAGWFERWTERLKAALNFDTAVEVAQAQASFASTVRQGGTGVAVTVVLALSKALLLLQKRKVQLLVDEALCVAARHGQVDVVAECIRAGAEPSRVRVPWGPLQCCSLIFIASVAGHADVLELLLLSSENARESDQYSEAREGNRDEQPSQQQHQEAEEEEEAAAAEEEEDCDRVGTQDDSVRTQAVRDPWTHLAAVAAQCRGHAAVVRLLVAHGFEVSVAPTEQHPNHFLGVTVIGPLIEGNCSGWPRDMVPHSAAQLRDASAKLMANGHSSLCGSTRLRGPSLEAVEKLAQSWHYALLSQPDDTSLAHAAQSEAGPLKQLQSWHGALCAESPLLRAVDAADPGMVSALLRRPQLGHGDGRRATDSTLDPEMPRVADGALPLLLSAARGHADVVRALLDHGADPRVELYGTNALHLGAATGHVSVVFELLRSGAVEPQHARPDGRTALLLALEGGGSERHAECARLLSGYSKPHHSRRRASRQRVEEWSRHSGPTHRDYADFKRRFGHGSEAGTDHRRDSGWSASRRWSHPAHANHDVAGEDVHQTVWSGWGPCLHDMGRLTGEDGEP
jgi:hypothetical protein